MKRAKRRGLLRNVAVALGTWGSPEAVAVLERALGDDEPLIRGHAAWALGRIMGRMQPDSDAATAMRSRLRECQLAENDDWVREEVGLALGRRGRVAATR